MKIPTRELTLVSLLASLAVVGRVYIAFIPNVQPVTAIIIISSFFLGPVYAVMLAIVSTIVTNFVLGMGMWTIWQMLTWSLIGLISALIGKVHHKIPMFILAIYSGVCGLIYGFFISIPYSLFSGNFWAYYLTGIPFDIYHAVGNVVFFIILYPILKKLFKTYLSGKSFG